MAIKVHQPFEPLSPASLGPDAQVPLATSENAGLLTNDMRRYLRGKISGRSFLVAGHRGGGKTTLVSNAFHKVSREQEGSSTRPLLVWLHGPNLLTIPDAGQAAAPAPPAPETQPAAQQAAQGSPLVTIVNTPAVAAPAAAGDRPRPRSRPTRDGNRAAAGTDTTGTTVDTDAGRDTNSTTRHRCAARPDRDDAPAASGRDARIRAEIPAYARDGDGDGRAPWQRRDLLELAAQLEIELFDRSNGSRLRELWRRARALDSGVLFAEPRYPDQDCGSWSP